MNTELQKIIREIFTMKNVVLSPAMDLYLCNVRKIYKELRTVFRLHSSVIDLNRTDLCHIKCGYVRSLLQNNLYKSIFNAVL